MKLGDYLNSINQTKENIIRNSDSQKQAEKLYPPFPVARSLSYHSDCILLVNELNTRGNKIHNIPNQQHYEFLLHVLDKKKRFSPWSKPGKEEHLELIKESFNYSTQKAEQVLNLFSDSDIEHLKKMKETGGKK